MTRTVFTRLKDGRIPGTLTRRLLNALVDRPGRIVSPDELGPLVWPDGPPPTWRNCLGQQGKHLDRILGGGVVERVGSKRRLEGFKLHVAKLPRGNLTAKRTKPPVRLRWSKAEDAVIRENAGRLPLSQLTTAVNAIHGRTRKPTAVEGRLYTLGLSKRIDAYTARVLAPILGVAPEKITRWAERGMLKARRWEPDGGTYEKRPGWWLIDQADIEAFIRAYPWELDWRAMGPSHPLTILARSIHLKDPYLTVGEFARKVGRHTSAIERWIREGRIEGARRVTPHSPKSSQALASIRIPLSALDTLKLPDRKRQRRTPGPMRARLRVVDKAIAQARVALEVHHVEVAI